MKWQPIETAPKDFSTVLIFEPDSSRNNEVGEGYFAPWEYEGDNAWHWSDNDEARPTHWMPLPEPPEDTQ